MQSIANWAPPQPAMEPEKPDLQGLVRELLVGLGEDPDREGLTRTPERVERSLQWLTRGYELTVEDAVGHAMFNEGHHNMVVVKDIEMYSMCEHHILPFFGKVHIGYIPNGRILGLSKLPRIVEVFARRLQVQERLTDQIAGALHEVLQPKGVAVVVEASHLCMMMRGVQSQNSRTVTSAMRGVFLEHLGTREEFLRLIHQR
jgi:GTP cyclohydrolase IA